MLSSRWTKLDHHDKQSAAWRSLARFLIIAAGRRSGKTELGKRKLVKEAISFHAFDNGKFIASAPTRDQAKRIYWDDLKSLSPPNLVDRIWDGDLRIRYINGANLWVVGMDKPQRAEGEAIDGIVMDEFAEMKPSAWFSSVRPALDTIGREGWAWFIGRPRGRNHFWQLARHAMDEANEDWDYYHWTSEEILSPKVIAEAKRDLDPMLYEQEYLASFINFEGRAYYPFDIQVHARHKLQYMPGVPLDFTFDFNVSPGVAGAMQTQTRDMYPDGFFPDYVADTFDAVIGHVWIPRNSNTPAVCRRLIQDWSHHQGTVTCYGDATGGARGTAKVMGSDWDLIRQELYPAFGTRLYFDVPKANPRERVRLNAVNARLRTADGKVHLLVSSDCGPVIDDFDGTSLLVGGSGEIDKKADSERSHMTDGIGYRIVRVNPLVEHVTFSQPLRL